MDTRHDHKQLGITVEELEKLETEALSLYPMPERPCDWKRKRITWLRFKYVEKAVKALSTTIAAH